MEPEWAGGCRDLEGEQQNCGTPGQTLLTKYSSIRDCSVSRRISTSPLWVTLKAGRLYGSCCCCSRSARPCEAGQPSSEAGGAGRSAAPRVQDASLPGVFVRGSPPYTLLPLPFPIFCLASPHPIQTSNSSLAPPGSLLELHLYTQARLCPI